MGGDEDLFPQASEAEVQRRQEIVIRREIKRINSAKVKLLARLETYKFFPNYQKILASFGGIPVSLLFNELVDFSKQNVQDAIIDLDKKKKIVPIMWGTNILDDFLKGHDILELILKLPAVKNNRGGELERGYERN